MADADPLGVHAVEAEELGATTGIEEEPGTGEAVPKRHHPNVGCVCPAGIT
jgi:hypothetical protein